MSTATAKGGIEIYSEVASERGGYHDGDERHLADHRANRSARSEAPARVRIPIPWSSRRRVAPRRRPGRPDIGRPVAPGGLLRASGACSDGGALRVSWG